MLKQTVALLVIVSLILLGSYWLKNFLGLNIFNHFSLSNYPVFSAFDSRVIDHQPFRALWSLTLLMKQAC